MNRNSLSILGPISRRLLAAQATRDLADIEDLRPAITCEACGEPLRSRTSHTGR